MDVQCAPGYRAVKTTPSFLYSFANCIVTACRNCEVFNAGTTAFQGQP